MTPQQSSPAFNLKKRPSTQQQLAQKLFVREEFAMIKFRDMELEDWQLHSARAWEVAGIFIKEMKRQKKKEKVSLESENANRKRKSANHVKPGIYKHDPTGWRISMAGPLKGIASNPQTGERMELIDFVAWSYGISREEAVLEILSLRAGKPERN